MISKAYLRFTTHCEKRGLGIQFMASPWLGLTETAHYKPHTKKGDFRQWWGSSQIHRLNLAKCFAEFFGSVFLICECF
jgi:hypothetical protein